MAFDDIFKEIGQFGRYSILLASLVMVLKFEGSLHSLGQVFFAGKSEHWCATKQWDDVNCEQYGYADEYECAFAKRNASIPYGKDGYESCKKYNVSGVPFDPSQPVDTSLPVIDCDEGWEFDRSQYQTTIITDYELVCDRKNLPNYAQSLYFAGYMAGSILFGWTAGRFGRYPTFVFLTFASGVTGILATFSPTYWLYSTARFLNGAVIYGSILVQFIIATEFVGPRWRTYTGVGLFYATSIGYFFLAGLAYGIRDWRTLLFIASVPYFFFGFFTLLSDESPRWLVSVGKVDKAQKVVKKMARVNKKEVQEKYHLESDTKNAERGTLLDLIKIPVLRWRLLNLMYNWFVQSLVYYGLSLSTSEMGVNDYIGFAISGFIEIPAYTLAIFTMDWLGRRISTGGFMIFGGIFCLLTIFTPLGPWTFTIAMLGKFGITASFGNIYVVSAENFPTPLRGLGMAVCSVSARIGGILCPFILLLIDYWEPLPLIIFGGNSIIAGVLVFLLPETNKKPLPQTVEEAINLDKLSPKESIETKDTEAVDEEKA